MHLLEWGQCSCGLCAHTLDGPYLLVACNKSPPAHLQYESDKEVVTESNVPPVKVLKCTSNLLHYNIRAYVWVYLYACKSALHADQCVCGVCECVCECIHVLIGHLCEDAHTLVLIHVLSGEAHHGQMPYTRVQMILINNTSFHRGYDNLAKCEVF